MKVAIINFLGTNCERDCLFACNQLSIGAEIVFHTQTSLKGFDGVILPGGFSYGDYLRCGALAKFSNIIKAIIGFASYGGYIMGICNGFQILTETKLLKGVLLKNRNLRFIHRNVSLKVEQSNCFFTKKAKNKILNMPIAHKDGNYFCDNDTLKMLNDNSMIVMRYSSQNGVISEDYNPNGSVENIAGICNEKGNIFGLMPHPERAVADLGIDGNFILSAFKEI